MKLYYKFNGEFYPDKVTDEYYAMDWKKIKILEMDIYNCENMIEYSSRCLRNSNQMYKAKVFEGLTMYWIESKYKALDRLLDELRRYVE